MEIKNILKVFFMLIFGIGYLWFIGEAFAHISVFLALGLILVGILSLIIYFRKDVCFKRQMSFFRYSTFNILFKSRT